MARSALIGIVAGAMWLQTPAVLPSHPAAALAAVMVAALVVNSSLPWLVRHLSFPSLFLSSAHITLRNCLRCSVAFAAGCAFGFYWAALLASSALSDALPKLEEGRDITVTGVIASLPNRNAQGERFNFAVEQASTSGVPPRIALSWFSGYRDQQQVVPDVQPGERWRLTVRLQRPHGNVNPDGFDYELWLLEQGVRATGYVRQNADNQRLDGFVLTFGNVVEHSRASLRDKILKALDGKPYAGVIVALVIGDQRAISQSDWDVFNRTGISHLVSISGLHITMLAGLAAWVAGKLWRHSFFTDAQLPLILPAQKAAAVAGVLVALAYVLLAGFGVPAQRTLYMLATIAVALWLDRLAAISHVLCLAAAVTVLLDPWAVLWPGFWLSFGAVAAILYATVGRDEQMQTHTKWSGFKAALYVQYAVTLGLTPLTMLLFAQVSLVSPLANAVAIPVISLLVTPLALAGALMPQWLAAPLLMLAHGAVWWLVQALQWLSAWPAAVWSAPAPQAWAFAWAAVGTAWMLSPRGWPVRWLGMVAWLPLLLAQPSHPAQGDFHVTAFDVGQGMALLVETRGHRLLYDAGPAYALESDGGNRVILPYLRTRGVHALDAMIVSHSDTDHAGGAVSVLRAVKVGWLASSLPVGHAALHVGVKHLRCVSGQTWQWDGVRFEMLHPSAASHDDPALKSNARSCVLKISGAGGSIMLAGDIEAVQEADLVARLGGSLKVDVLLAPHHGSATSSTVAFLRAAQPSMALFQVGYRNRYHHPNAAVWDRYEASGIQRWRTDDSGALELSFSKGKPVQVQALRLRRPRYWYEAGKGEGKIEGTGNGEGDSRQ